MDKNYDTKSIENILTMLKGFVYNVEFENFFINVYITTCEGLCRNLKISNNKDNTFEINKNILVYNDSAISLRDIIKIKISLNDIRDKNLKELLNKKLRNIILYNNRNYQINNQGLVRKYNYKNDDYNIENYIQNNYKNIKKLRYSGINSESKTLKSSLGTKKYRIITQPMCTSAVRDINYNTSSVIKNLNVDYTKNAIVNIDSKNQILKSKKIEVLEIEPINKYIDKSELGGRRLRFDPTGENYVGVVLDDGTFEPLKLELKTYNVLEDNVENYIGNIDSNNQLKTIVSKVDSSKNQIIDNIQVKYNENLVEYKDENIKDINIMSDSSNNTIEEEINGNIEIVGGGIVVVEDCNEEIIIYSTSKITSVN